MLAASIFYQQNGDTTKAYYAKMNSCGFPGQLAVALFRAQKRSAAAKRYGRSRYKHDAYDVKNWSLSEIVRVLNAWNPEHIKWGWGYDSRAVNFEHVLYVDLPNGQCSFHSGTKLAGPRYEGKWNPGEGSQATILAYCDSVYDTPEYVPTPEVLAEVEKARQEWRKQMADMQSEASPESQALF